MTEAADILLANRGPRAGAAGREAASSERPAGRDGGCAPDRGAEGRLRRVFSAGAGPSPCPWRAPPSEAASAVVETCGGVGGGWDGGRKSGAERAGPPAEEPGAGAAACLRCSPGAPLRGPAWCSSGAPTRSPVGAGGRSPAAPLRPRGAFARAPGARPPAPLRRGRSAPRPSGGGVAAEPGAPEEPRSSGVPRPGPGRRGVPPAGRRRGRRLPSPPGSPDVGPWRIVTPLSLRHATRNYLAKPAWGPLARELPVILRPIPGQH